MPEEEKYITELGPATPSGRRIRFVQGSSLWEADILTFVVLMTRNTLQTQDADEIAAHTPAFAQLLVNAGWFTEEEYLEAWTANVVEGVDEELEKLTKEEGK